jgi:colanic acid/amylovoran biosynthesis glycosyltransferase
LTIGPKKPLAYLVSQYPAVNHTFIMREIRGLRQLGIDVRVASVRAPDRSPDRMSEDEREEAGSTYYIRPKGIGAAIRTSLRGLLSMPGPFFSTLAFAIRSSRWNVRSMLQHLRFFSEAVMTGFWMKELGIEHLHTHFASTVALFTGAMFPIKFSATIHGSGEFEDPAGFLMRDKVRAAHLIIAISSYGRSQVMRSSTPRDWGKISVVRLGVNMNEFAPSEKNARRPGPFEVICVGQLAPAKGQHILLRACASLIRDGHPLLLRLVGDGPDRKDLEESAAALGISGSVIFHGAQSHNRVLELYRQADAFVLASFAEGVPVVLMESMALELPCVATAITGVPELIRNEVEGLLVPASDADALAKAMVRLMDDPALGRSLGMAGRKKIAADYNLSRNIELLAETFAAASIV